MTKSVALSLLLLTSVAAFAPPRAAFRPRAPVATTASPAVRQLASFALRATQEDETDTAVQMRMQKNRPEAPLDAVDETCVAPEEEEELSETKKLMQQVKDAGTAGIISYALWEVGFWAVSVPVVFAGYREVTGHWPDVSNKEDVEKLGAEAFAFVNFARFAVPLRIGLALGTTPWIQENIMDRFFPKEPFCDPLDPEVENANGSTPSKRIES
jgi:hypothetical protein